MSAVFDTLTDEAREREERGFTTMRPRPLGLPIVAEAPWSTANEEVVNLNTALSVIVVAYGARKVWQGTSMWDSEVQGFRPHIVRSDNFFVQLQGNTATMAGGSIFLRDIESHPERGVVVLKMPRKVVYSQQVSFITSKLKRKTPRLVFGGRDQGEE